MTTREFDAAGRHILAYLPDDPRAVIYIHASENDPAPVMRMAGELSCAVVWVQGCYWERDFTPWPMPRIFRKGEDFKGEAEDYLDLLTDRIIPRTEEMLGIEPKVRAIAGYSLGGLFALYASYLTEDFDAVCSISGSLWYEGWIDFMTKGRCLARYVHMSLGEGESKVKKQYFSRVEDCTKMALSVLTRQGTEARLDMTDGTHRELVHERIAGTLKLFAEKIETL